MARPVVLCAVGHAVDRIRTQFPEVDVVDVSDGVPPGVRGEILFGGMGQPSVDAMAHGVRWVQLAGTGIDGFPDEVTSAELVTSARGASAVAISEYVLAAMAAFARDLPGNWLRAAPEHWHFQPATTLAGATVGLFGFGGIGQRVARLARAFEMEVVAQRRTPGAVPGVEMVQSFDELIGRADHLVLAAPATDETRHVVRAASLARAKPGLHLVNVARGALVDQEALRAALDDGTVARASLDVVEPEPLPEGHWLYTHPKVFLTPHTSWCGPPFLAGAIDLFCENLARYLAGQPLEHLVHDGY